jgi:hypothetical protein
VKKIRGREHSCPKYQYLGADMTIDFVGWQERVLIDPRGHNDGHNQGERLPTGAGKEGVAAEERITRNETFVDKPSLSWTGEVAE